MTPDLRQCVRDALDREGRQISELARALVEAKMYSYDTAIYRWLSGGQDLGYDKLRWILDWCGINLEVDYSCTRALEAEEAELASS